MKKVIKTMSILMLTFFLTVPCFARRVDIVKKPDMEKSIPIQLSVEADIDDDTRLLTVLFLEDLGDVYVEVRNNDGKVIYCLSLEALTSNEVAIWLMDEPAGNFELFIIGEGDTGYYGYFQLY